MCKGNEHVFHGKGDSRDDFFFMYVFLFNKMYIRLPFDHFHMGVLRELNVAPSQLHLNGWVYMQAFEALCVTLHLTLTLTTFLHYFCTCPKYKTKVDFLDIRAWRACPLRYSPPKRYAGFSRVETL